jgi:GDP-L-fucose synthase
MPTNLYGPNDNYDLNNSHVLPAMIRKLHLAKLAQAGDIDGINRDEAAHGIIPEDIRAMLGLSPQPSVLGTQHCLLSPQHSALSSQPSVLSTVSSVLSPQSSVTLWGTGTPRREFLYSEDMADACIFLLNMSDNELDSFLSPDASDPPLINIGCGEDLTIRELAEMVAEVVGFKGSLTFDTSKPDGTMRKVMDVSRINALGWKRTMQLKDGIALSYRDMLSKI